MGGQQPFPADGSGTPRFNQLLPPFDVTITKLLVFELLKSCETLSNLVSKPLSSELEWPMTNTTMINYSTRDFATKEQLELYLLRQEKAFSPEVIKLFTEAGMLRRVVTQIWNKEQSHRVGIVFEYRDQEAYKACQALLEEHYLPAVEGLTTKVVGSRGVIVHEFVSDEFQD